jgi:ectoine hydroxylase-related dioxygenase (phytanoyl-CoA dioxygenase family)
MTDIAKAIRIEGYYVLKNAVSLEDIQVARQAIDGWRVQGNDGFCNSGGISIPGFVAIPELAPVAALKDNVIVRAALAEVLTSDYRFCAHNDIGIGRTVGWHKDKLNGAYAKYQATNIWKPTANGDRHEIVKVLFYLQDQHDAATSLHVVPGSHTTPGIAEDGSVMVQLDVGDALIFDQRITHRGARQRSFDRILVAFGYGRNNRYTSEFERGTVARQTVQAKNIVRIKR